MRPGVHAILVVAALLASSLGLAGQSRADGMGPKLKLDRKKMIAYAKANCGRDGKEGTNDCPGGTYDADCTHFVTHARAE